MPNQLSLDEYIERLEEVSRDLENRSREIAFEYGQSLVDQIMERIQTEGRGPDGGLLKSYSPAYLRFKKAPQNTKRGKDLGLGSSRYTGVVDYTLTGEMWRNIGLVKENVSGDKVKMSWDGRSELTRKKMQSMSDRDGDLLKPSNIEIEIALEDVEIKLERILQPIL